MQRTTRLYSTWHLYCVSRRRAGNRPLSDVQGSEHVLTVTNGNPGLDRLRILVNQNTVVLPLKNGETRTLNLKAWMAPASNSIGFTGDGVANASASLVLKDATAKIRKRTRQPGEFPKDALGSSQGDAVRPIGSGTFR